MAKSCQETKRFHFQYDFRQNPQPPAIWILCAGDSRIFNSLASPLPSCTSLWNHVACSLRWTLVRKEGICSESLQHPLVQVAAWEWLRLKSSKERSQVWGCSSYSCACVCRGTLQWSQPFRSSLCFYSSFHIEKTDVFTILTLKGSFLPSLLKLLHAIILLN